MAHYPVNHRLRGLYRGLAALAGLFLVAYGVVGLIAASRAGFFGHGGYWALGLRTNPAQSWLALACGIVVTAAAVLGENLHHRVNMLAGWTLIVLAIVLMCTMRTDANVLNFSIVNVVVFITLGLVILCAALYGKVESDPDRAAAEQDASSAARH
jgi:hypothetical protein